MQYARKKHKKGETDTNRIFPQQKKNNNNK